MKLAFSLDKGSGARARFGLIVLQADETIEPEFARMLGAPGVALHHTRIRMTPNITTESLITMQAEIPLAAAMLPATRFDAVGYACTSGATVIGPENVETAVKAGCDCAHVSDPLSASIAALHHIGARKIAYISPYVETVTALMRARLSAAGLEVATFASFEESDDRIVSHISQADLLQAIVQITAKARVDAVFVSCTNLRVLDILAEAEALTGKPVVSSNTALAWHMCRLAGLGAMPIGPGRLLQRRAKEKG